MTEIVVFGGTAEGRALCELLGQKRIAALVCVATEYGTALLPAFTTLRVQAGRLDQAAMETLLRAEQPRLVIDATHPYAALVSENIRAACTRTGVRCLRLGREALPDGGSVLLADLDAMIDWLNARPGTVFSTLGAKEVQALTRIEGYRERVWLRVLPDVAGLAACLAAGFPARRIICMQGPFSEALNTAMFRAAKADILLTKESGAVGGYPEKLAAARACGMSTAVLARPGQETGLTLAALSERIEAGTLWQPIAEDML